MRSCSAFIVSALLSLGLASSSFAAQDGAAQVLLEEYLESLIADGIRVIYSSDLVTGGMHVAPPSPDQDPFEMLPALLQPHGLQMEPGPAGTVLIVAAASADTREEVDSTPTLGSPMPEIIVTSSLHRIEYNAPGVHTVLDKDVAARVPVIGEEFVRLTQRLPGTASGGISSKSYVRGGEDNEVLFLFDGLRLYEPYHLRDFQSVASIISSSAMEGTDFYTGAYPAHFGDRMSGVLSMDMRKASSDTETELAISFFNTSALSMGRFGPTGQGDWLFSARRGNLDLITDVIDPEFGSPDYSDMLSHVAWEFGPRALVSANVLVSDDKVSLSDASRGEQARARYSNRVAWLKWGADWTDQLRSRTIFAVSDVTDDRQGTVELPGIVSGWLDSQRDLQVFEFRQDWTWLMSSRWMWSFGANLKHLDADYRHRSHKQVEPPFDAILDNQPNGTLSSDRVVDGGQYAAYSEVRWMASDRYVIDLGLRWDQQTYTIASNDRQYSPRAGLLWHAGKNTEVRFGWGQYYQAQETNELQLSDGIEDFFPAQRAEHFVLNVQRQITKYATAELSVFRKSFRTLRPRFENAFNSLTLVPEIQFDRIRVDPRKAESLGAELSIMHGTASDSLIWWASYAWAQTRDWTDDGKIERSWDQTHTVKAGLSRKRGSWDLSAALEVHTGWPKNELIPTYILEPDGTRTLLVETTPRNELRYGTFATVDFRAARTFDVRRGELTAFLDVSNVVNRANPCCIEYSLNDSGELDSRARHWLPLVPSLGVVWRF